MFGRRKPKEPEMETVFIEEARLPTAERIEEIMDVSGVTSSGILTLSPRSIATGRHDAGDSTSAYMKLFSVPAGQAGVFRQAMKDAASAQTPAPRLPDPLPR